MELSHQYKSLLTTTVSYSLVKKYFSQLFLTDTAKGILFYSEGNVGKAYKTTRRSGGIAGDEADRVGNGG